MKRMPWVFAVVPLLACLALVATRPAASSTVPPPEPAAVVAPEDGPSDLARLRLFAKEDVARDVIAGRRSLFEAAALFQALNAMAPERVPPEGLLAGTPEGRVCTEVIENVAAILTAELGPEGDEVECVPAGLEAEFRHELARAGVVRLPAVSADALIEQTRAELTREEGTGRAYWLASRAGPTVPR